MKCNRRYTTVLFSVNLLHISQPLIRWVGSWRKWVTSMNSWNINQLLNAPHEIFFKPKMWLRTKKLLVVACVTKYTMMSRGHTGSRCGLMCTCMQSKTTAGKFLQQQWLNEPPAQLCFRMKQQQTRWNWSSNSHIVWPLSSWKNVATSQVLGMVMIAVDLHNSERRKYQVWTMLKMYHLDNTRHQPMLTEI